MISELQSLKDTEIRGICKDKIESLEHWLRRLIDDTLTPVYGDYFNHEDDKGNRLISGGLSKTVEKRQQEEPSRYPRKIDAILLDDAIGIICKPELFKKHFRVALDCAFPDGEAEARTFLLRLSEPRNNLAHANPISVRQAERIICYSNDVIESLKKYYREVGMQQEYNVPLILKVTDSFGNVFTRNNDTLSFDRLLINLIHKPEFFLRPGDVLTIEVEVDPSFDSSTYEVSWNVGRALMTVSGSKVVIEIGNQHVGESFGLSCSVKSNKDWHRMELGYDDLLLIYYKVLPPLE